MVTSPVHRIDKAMHAHIRLLWLSLVLPDSSPRLFACVLIRKFPFSYSWGAWMRLHVSGLHSSKESRCIALCCVAPVSALQRSRAAESTIHCSPNVGLPTASQVIVLSVLVLSLDTESTNKPCVSIATYLSYLSCHCFWDHVPKGKRFIKEGHVSSWALPETVKLQLQWKIVSMRFCCSSGTKITQCICMALLVGM